MSRTAPELRAAPNETVASELWPRINQGVRRERTQESPMKPMARITTVFLALVALAQFLRLVLQVEVTAGGVSIPLWASALACVFTGGLSIMLWRENKR
jgi:Na+/proline symporter